MRNVILQGDSLAVLKTLPSDFVQCVVTSPPFYGLRDYGTAQWEGGSPECAHRVGNQVQDNKAPGAIMAGVRPGVDASRCKLCGAIRIDQQIGLEEAPEAYVAKLVEVFREVRRVLRSDGVAWVNLGDSYAGSWGNYAPGGIKGIQRERSEEGKRWEREAYSDTTFLPPSAKSASFGLKDKDLIGIPWMVAFALRADGWWLRSDCIWAKGNPMPESVQDRPTRSHEYVFLLSKSQRYFYDNESIKEPGQEWSGQAGTFARANGKATHLTIPGQRSVSHREDRTDRVPSGRNKRSVWHVNTAPFPEAHFATFPEKLVSPMILSGSSPQACEHCGAPWERVTERIQFGKAPSDTRYTDEKMQATRLSGSRQAYRAMGLEGPPAPKTVGWQPTCRCKNEGTGKCVVLDPFMGSGTTALVALQHGRDYLGVELNPQYVAMANKRISQVQQNLWTTEGVI